MKAIERTIRAELRGLGLSLRSSVGARAAVDLAKRMDAEPGDRSAVILSRHPPAGGVEDARFLAFSQLPPCGVFGRKRRVRSGPAGAQAHQRNVPDDSPDELLRRRRPIEGGLVGGEALGAVRCGWMPPAQAATATVHTTNQRSQTPTRKSRQPVGGPKPASGSLPRAGRHSASRRSRPTPGASPPQGRAGRVGSPALPARAGARPMENDPSPAPMQLGEASGGGFVFVDELVEHAGHGAPGWSDPNPYVKIPAKPSLLPSPAGTFGCVGSDPLGAKGSLHVHNVAAARQRLDPEERPISLSVPHHGQATVNHPVVVPEATTGVFIAGASFLSPVRPTSAVPKPSRYMPR